MTETPSQMPTDEDGTARVSVVERDGRDGSSLSISGRGGIVYHASPSSTEFSSSENDDSDDTVWSQTPEKGGGNNDGDSDSGRSFLTSTPVNLEDVDVLAAVRDTPKETPSTSSISTGSSRTFVARRRDCYWLSWALSVGFSLVANMVVRRPSRGDQSLKEAFRASKKPIAWSVLMAMSVILVGYAQALVISLVAQPQFQARYGNPDVPAGENGNTRIDATWMFAVQICAVGSATVGALAVG